MGECSLYETATQEVNTMYNDEFNNNDMYRFTNRDVPHDDYAPAPRQENTYTAPVKKQGFFRRTWVKVTALVLACAVVVLRTMLDDTYKSADDIRKYTGMVVLASIPLAESDRTVTAVQIKKVDGKTKMQPAEVYASTVNSTVSINCSSQSTNIFGQTTQSASSGSGFIISEDGYIVTNYHVINGASSVKLTLYNGNTYDATVIGGDSDYDVAVLKINAAGLTPVTLGNSADVNVGDSVLAIGNPLGELTFSMSGGYVSSCNRAINVDGTPFNMIQVDCSINPGNSGGPLMNLYGEVVGIVSAKYSTYSSTTVEGLGFAIPIDDVKPIITDIMENGAVTGKAYMAVTVGTMNSQMAAQYSIDIDQGVFVYSVVKGGAGDKAGLRLGDVITKMGDTTLTSRQDLSAALKSYRAGDTATLTVFRDGSYITTDITFDQQPQITGTDTEEDTSSQGGNNGGYNGQMPENWQEFYNYFFGNRG